MSVDILKRKQEHFTTQLARISHTVESCKCLPLGTTRSTCNLENISGTDVTHVDQLLHTTDFQYLFFYFKTNCD